MSKGESSHLIVSYIPSFYKVELYNRISEIEDIFVIFLKDNEGSRNANFVRQDMRFPHMTLQHGDGKFAKISGLRRLLDLLLSRQFSTVTTPGWDQLACWILILLPFTWQRRMVMESTSRESQRRDAHGMSLKSWVYRLAKSLFMRHVDLALVAGKRQEAYLREHGFQGPFRNLLGVGLTFAKPFSRLPSSHGARRFLYLGRLSSEKNLDFMIEAFLTSKLVEDQASLTLVGEGPLEDQLRSRFGSEPGIIFAPYVEREVLPQMMAEYDALVLLSLSEPYGLVVEEALKCDMPVLLSHACGAVDTIVFDGVQGLVVSPYDSEGATKAFSELASRERYNGFLQRIQADPNLERIDEAQISGYLSDGRLPFESKEEYLRLLNPGSGADFIETLHPKGP